MNSYDRFADRIVLDAGERLFQLREKLQDLKNAEYPSDAPLQLIQLLDLIGNRLSEKLIALSKRIAGEHISEEKWRLSERVGRIARFVSVIYRWLGAIELAQSRYSPQELVLPLEEIGKHIYPRSSLLICPYYEENYTYAEIIGHVMSGLGKVLEVEGKFLLAEYPEYFAVISFPSAAKSNVLQHAVFAHELGHLANDVYRFSESIRDTIELELGAAIAQTADNYLKAKFPGGLAEEDHIKYKSDLNWGISILLEQWLGEMVADVYACHLWGLASFLANAYYLLTLQSLDMWSSGHPSARFRLQVMLDEIERLGYCALLKECGLKTVEEELEQWHNLVETNGQEPSFALEDAQGVVIWTILQGAAYSIAREVLEDVRQQAEQEIHRYMTELPDAHVPNSQDMYDIVSLTKILHERIPPCELGDGREKPYAGISAILNAGWIHRLTYTRDASEWNRPVDLGEFFIDRIKEEDSLILRAIDLSEIYRLFDTRREQR